MKVFTAIKHILLFVLIAAMLSGAVGCNNTADPGNTPDTTDAGADTAAPDTTEAPVFVMPDDLVNVVTECSVPNDGTECTSKLRSAILRFGRVFLPAGTYRVSATLGLSDDFMVVGEEGTKIIVSGGCDLFHISGKIKKETEPAVRVKNVTLANLEIESETPINQYVMNAKSFEDLLLYNLNVRNMGCLVTNIVYPVNGWDGTYNPAETAGVLNDDYVSKGLTVSHCTVDCGNCSETGASAVYMQFLTDFLVENTNVSNGYQGIQFWGGDSNYVHGGKPDNPFYAKHGVIRNCTADHFGGGIWGSMGEDILITHSEASNCFDVGIDFEGCRDVAATYCKSSNCVNGNYSTFMYCTGKVLFSYCESYLDAEHTQHYFNSNPQQEACNHDITFDHCTFTSDGLSRIICSSAMTKFTFTNNTCVNTVLDTTARNVYDVTIEDNTFRMDVALDEERAFVINATCNYPDSYTPTETTVRVNRNSVTSTVEQEYPGIIVAYTNGKRKPPHAVECRGNTVKGFPHDIEISGYKTGNASDTDQPFSVTFADNTADTLIVTGRVNLTEENNKTNSGQVLSAVHN